MRGATIKNGKTFLPGNTRYSGFFWLLTFSMTCRGQLITTIAGGGNNYSGASGIQATSAVIQSPQGVATDSADNVYYVDAGNYVVLADTSVARIQAFRVRKVNAQGIVSTVAGGTAAGDSGNGGLATSAQFLGIEGIAVDNAGSLYIADNGNFRPWARSMACNRRAM